MALFRLGAGAMADGAAGRSEIDDFWYSAVGAGSSSGATVSAETAMRLSTVYAAVRLIAETEGQLPLQLYRRESNGDKELMAGHPVYELIHSRPNDEHTAIEFREMLTAWAVLRGTGMAEIIPGPRGAVDQLIPLHPDYITPVKVTDTSGRERWQIEYREAGAPARRILRSELFIVRAMGINPACPLLGLDPIQAQRDTIGAAQGAADYGARFLANDARPSGVIQHPSYFKDEESRSLWKRAWQAAFGGSNRHRTAVLEWGMTYQQISVTPEQAQFLETRKLNSEDIARIFRVQPHKIGMLDRSTNNNIEQQALEFISETMMPWLVRWEQAIRRDLLSEPGLYAEHNVSGLLRGDLKTRSEAFAIGRNWGWLNVNEIRRMENMNSIGPEGDVYLQPLNMTEAGDPDEPSGQSMPPPRRQDGDRAAQIPLETIRAQLHRMAAPTLETDNE